MRKILLASTALVLCMGSGNVAQAQTAPSGNQTAGGIEEVTVTAEKRPERLRDAPVSVAVLSTVELAQKNVADIADINNLVPSVQLNGTFSGRVPLGVRGISTVTNEQTVGISSGVAIMVDGVPVPSDSQGGNQLQDIAQVEVLKGPQATLGGRTAAAGEINIVTRGPSDTFTASISAQTTDTIGSRFNAFVAGPLTDQLQYSLSGYYDRNRFPVTNILTNKNSYQDTYGGRAKLRFQPTEDLDVTLMLHASENDTQGFNFVYTHIDQSNPACLAGPCPLPPNQWGATLLGTPPWVGLTTQNLLPGITADYNNHDLISSTYLNPKGDRPGALVIDTDASVVINYRVSDLTVTSTTAYLDERQHVRQDLFNIASITVPAGYGPPGFAPWGHAGPDIDNCANGGQVYFFQYLTHCTAPNFDDMQHSIETVTQLSEELKIVSPSDQPFSWFVGLFYSDSTVQMNMIRPFVGSQLDMIITPDQATYDVYGRASWEFIPDTKLVVGLRYNYDVIKYNYVQNHYAVSDIVTGDNIDQGYNYSSGRDAAGVVVGDVSLQHKFSENSMAYITYARGYSPRAYNTSQALFGHLYGDTAPKVGGCNPFDLIPCLDNADNHHQLTPVKEEMVDSYEIGSKGVYFDNHLSLNVAAFETFYTNYQVQTFKPCPPGASGNCSFPTLVLQNAGARTRGLEVDSTLQATDTLTLTLNAAWIKATFENYLQAPCYPTKDATDTQCYNQTFQNISGMTMPNAPKLKVNFSAEKKFSFDMFDLNLNGSYAYRTKAVMMPDEDPYGTQGAFGILDLSATARDKSGTYAVTLFVNNVTDKMYYSDVEDFWGSPWGNNNVVMGQPAADARRYVGIRFSADY